jgi:ATP-dependent protease ClpP protease subunit
MSAEEAKDYGIIDSVIAQHRAIQKEDKEKIATL